MRKKGNGLNREKVILFILFSVMFALKTYAIYLSFDLYYDGQIFSTIQKETIAIQRDNMKLEDEYLYNASLQTILQKARNMGFVDTSYAVLYKDHVEIIKPR